MEFVWQKWSEVSSPTEDQVGFFSSVVMLSNIGMFLRFREWGRIWEWDFIPFFTDGNWSFSVQTQHLSLRAHLCTFM